MSLKLALTVALVCGVWVPSSCWGQGTGGTGGTGGTTTDTGTNTGTGGNQNQGGGDVTGMNDPLQLGDLLTIGQEFTRDSMFENDRIQPFVGPSAANIVHPRSQIDPAGSTLGSSGGGGGGFTFSTQGQNQSRGGAQSSGFGGTGSSQGFTVARRGVRSDVAYRPMFLPAGEVVQANFNSRLSRLPALQNIGSVTMQVDNRVATLRGTVASEDQRSLIVRQAALEPGVDRVINELQVNQ